MRKFKESWNTVQVLLCPIMMHEAPDSISRLLLIDYSLVLIIGVCRG